MGDVLSGTLLEMHDAELHIERPDGLRVIVIVNIAPLTDNRGDITGAINCFYNLTSASRPSRCCLITPGQLAPSYKVG